MKMEHGWGQVQMQWQSFNLERLTQVFGQLMPKVKLFDSGHTALCQNRENFTVCEEKGMKTKARWW